jgi:hypothetical protein
MEHKIARHLLVLIPQPALSQVATLESTHRNTGRKSSYSDSRWFEIKNLADGTIRDDEGALGTKGNSKDEELEVSHGPYSSRLRTRPDTVMDPGAKIPLTPSPQHNLAFRPTLVEALLAKSRRGSAPAWRTWLVQSPYLSIPN